MKKLILSLIFSIPYFVFSQSGFSYKIIGFSKDGLISYVTFRESQNLESGGPGDYEFFVYDLKSDKILYEDMDTIDQIESFIINDYKNILSSYDIIMSSYHTSIASSYHIQHFMSSYHSTSSCHVVSYHLSHRHILSYHIMISYAIISYRIVSYHNMSYHLISYRT